MSLSPIWDWKKTSEDVKMRNLLTLVQQGPTGILCCRIVAACLSTWDWEMKMYLPCILPFVPLGSSCNVFQVPFCKLEMLECINNTKIDTSICLPPCAGLIITSFAKSEQSDDLESKECLQNVMNEYYNSTSHCSMLILGYLAFSKAIS